MKKRQPFKRKWQRYKSSPWIDAIYENGESRRASFKPASLLNDIVEVAPIKSDDAVSSPNALAPRKYLNASPREKLKLIFHDDSVNGFLLSRETLIISDEAMSNALIEIRS